MRINKYVAQATGISRRSADEAIRAGKVRLNGIQAKLGDEADANDEVFLNNHKLKLAIGFTTLMLNKPTGYVCSRNGQGSKTIYDLLPDEYHRLKPIGRLDKDSSGLLLLTDDGELANKLTHPRYQKEKVYRVKLNKTLEQKAKEQLLTGVELSDGLSKFIQLKDCSDAIYEVILTEGKNRQIRRTFNALGYKTISLHRIKFGSFDLSQTLMPGNYMVVSSELV